MSTFINITKDIPEEEIKAVYITCSCANLTVKESSEKFAHIECKNVPEGSAAEISEGVLRIKIKKPSFKEMIFHSPLNSASCELSLPAKLYDTFDADIGMGNANIISTQCGSANIRSGHSNLSIDKMKVQKMTRIESGLGNVDIDGLECGPLEIRSGVGNVKAVNSTAAGLDVQGGTGNIKFEGTVNGNIDVKGGVGDIKLKLFGDPSLYGGKYSLKTSHGIGKVAIEYAPQPVQENDSGKEIIRETDIDNDNTDI